MTTAAVKGRPMLNDMSMPPESRTEVVYQFGSVNSAEMGPRLRIISAFLPNSTGRIARVRCLKTVPPRRPAQIGQTGSGIKRCGAGVVPPGGPSGERYPAPLRHGAWLPGVDGRPSAFAPGSRRVRG